MKTVGGAVAAAIAALAAAQWTAGPDLPLPRAGYMAGVVGRRLVIAGGSYWEAGQKRWSNRTDYYDPAQRAWSPGPPLPEPRSDAASLVIDGVLHTWGGGAGGSISAECWQLQNGGWRRLPQMDLPEPRLYALAASLDGTVFILGGIREAAKHESAANTLWRWDGKRRRWSAAAPLPPPGRSLNAVAASNGKLYVFGGYTMRAGAGLNLSEVWAYDPAADRWTGAGEFPFARRAWWAVPGSAGRVFLFGGYTDTFSDEIWEYDTGTQRSRRVAHLPHPLADSKFFNLAGVYVAAGGESGDRIRFPGVIQGTF